MASAKQVSFSVSPDLILKGGELGPLLLGLMARFYKEGLSIYPAIYYKRKKATGSLLSYFPS